MACHGCKRQLSLLTRQANTTTEVLYTAAVQQLPRRVTQRAIPTSQRLGHQRRGFRSSVPQESKIGDLFRSVLQRTAKPYQVVGATKVIYKECANKATYTTDPVAVKADTLPKTPEGEHIGQGSKSIWFDEFKLSPTFSTWSQVTMLHLYMVFARARDLPPDEAKAWHGQLVDHFFFDAEERMDVSHGITSRGLRHRYLKDLFVQWRGVIAAYDEGIMKGDAVLASAIWRNLYKGREDVDISDLAAVVSYVRIVLKDLDQMHNFDLYDFTVPVLRQPISKQFAVVDQPVQSLKRLIKPDAAAQKTEGASKQTAQASGAA